MAQRLLILAAFVVAGCGGSRAATPATTPQKEPLPPVQAHHAAAERTIKRDFARRFVPNRWGVGASQLRLNGPTLEAWSALPATRAGMRGALALCERLYHRYVVLPLGSLAGQAAVYSRSRVLMAASLRYKPRCYALIAVR